MEHDGFDPLGHNTWLLLALIVFVLFLAWAVGK